MFIIEFLFVLVFTGLLVYVLVSLILIGKNQKSALERHSTRVTTLGIMAALSAVFQGAPVFLPVAGLVLSPLSSLPIAIGTLLYPEGAIVMFLGTSAIISVIHIEEAIVFVLTTGPIGLASPLAAMNSRSKWKNVWVSSLTLASGILTLTYILGLPGLAKAFGHFGIYVVMLLVLLFSIAYSYLWNLIVLNKTIYVKASIERL